MYIHVVSCYQILDRLLVAAVADADAGVRKAVLHSLHENASFDAFLSQADSLRAIFISLNDEVIYPVV
jgi:FKBP12-rapamycin complex-associated protein